MITIKNDYVHISFPQIIEALYQQAEKYIDKHLPKILQDNQNRHLNGDKRASDADVEEKFREEVEEEMIRLCRPELFSIVFERRLRVPNDGKNYTQPRLLGALPLRQPQEFATTVPPSWLDENEPVTVMLPMHQSEAMRLFFHGIYPCAIKVGSGKVNAITGSSWQQPLQHEPDDFVSTPKHKSIDGFAVPSGSVRPFVAVEAGATSPDADYPSASTEDNRLMLQIIPLKASVYFRRKIRPVLPNHLNQLYPELLANLFITPISDNPTEEQSTQSNRNGDSHTSITTPPDSIGNSSPQRGCERIRWIYLGNRIRRRGMLRDENEDGSAREDVFFDDHKPSHWDNKLSANCVVQICSAQQWLAITGNKPPQPAIAPEVFSKNNIPWLDRYDAELQALKNADRAVAKSAKSRSTPTDLKSSSSE